MAKKKTGKKLRKQSHEKPGSKPGAKANAKAKPDAESAGEPCPVCGETRPLYWHGRRVLCEPCVQDNTHEAERGDATMGGVVRGAVALFRDVGWPIVGLMVVYAAISATASQVLDLDEVQTIVLGAVDLAVYLIFLATGFDYALTRLDGERPSLASSAGMGVRKFLPLFVAIQVQNLIITVYLALLIIPGVMKALSLALVTPLVVSGEAGALTCLYESGKRMSGHRKAVAPLLVLLWIPWVALQLLGLVAFAAPGFEDAPWLVSLYALAPIVDLPWIFVILTLHAKLRAQHRLRA